MHVTRKITALQAMSEYFTYIREVYMPPTNTLDYAGTSARKLPLRDARLDRFLQSNEVLTLEDILNLPITSLLDDNIEQGTVDRLWTSLNLLHFDNPLPYVKDILGKEPKFLSDLVLPHIYLSRLSDISLEYLSTATVDELLERMSTSQLLRIHRAVTAYGYPMLVGHPTFGDLLPHYGLDREQFLALSISDSRVRNLRLGALTAEELLDYLTALPYNFKLYSIRYPLAQLLYDELANGRDLGLDVAGNVIRDLLTDLEWKLLSTAKPVALSQVELAEAAGVTRQRVGQIFDKVRSLLRGLPNYSSWKSQLVEKLDGLDEHIHVDTVMEILASIAPISDTGVALLLTWAMMDDLDYRRWSYDPHYYVTGKRAQAINRTVHRITRTRNSKYAAKIRSVMCSLNRPVKVTELLEILQPDLPDLTYQNLYNLLNSRTYIRVAVGTFAHPKLQLTPMPKRLSSCRKVIQRELAQRSSIPMAELEDIIVQDRKVQASWARKNIRDHCVVDGDMVVGLKTS